MRIRKVEIRHFRSILKLDFDATHATVICGPNSCGKSNIIRALKFAFLPFYSPERMGANFSHSVASPNAYVTVKITFDAPTPGLAAAMGLHLDQPLVYQVRVKRNGSASFKLNGETLDEQSRARFLDEVVVVHVPPIRDLAAGGLDPFKATLAAAIRKSRGANSLAHLSERVRATVKASGSSILSGAQASAKSLLDVESLSVDVSGIGLDGLLPLAGITFTVAGVESTLDKLGTGHQSSVILSLYRQLGVATGKFVLFLFEEPDNHLHPTSIRAVADELKECLIDHSQVFITTHSPYFLNQFAVTDWLPLAMSGDRSTTVRSRNLASSDRELRLAFGRHGLRPSEALLSKRVVVVEGANDVTLVRELVELRTGRTPDQQDILILPAVGKEGVSELCLFLDQLGANWLGVLDWDAIEDTRQPMFKAGITAAELASASNGLDVLAGLLRTYRGRKTKALKAVDSMKFELAHQANPLPPSPHQSVLGIHLSRADALTASETAALWQSIRKRRFTSIRPILDKANLWLWSDAPEAVLLHSVEAEDIAERVLVQSGELGGPVPGVNRRATLANALHGLAHRPEVLRLVIRELHANQQLRGREWRELVKRVAE